MVICPKPKKPHAFAAIARLKRLTVHALWSCLIAAAVCAPLPAAAGPLECARSSVTVETDHPEEVLLICEAAAHILATLRACGIESSKPRPIKVVPATQIEPRAQSYGCYEPASGSISLISMQASARMLKADPQRAAIDPVEYYRSVVMHEVAHSLFHEVAAASPISMVAHEYLAYALQFEALSVRSRSIALALGEGMRVRGPAVPDDMLLFINPAAFAAVSYLHFRALNDRCGTIRRVLAGELTFERPYE